MNRRANTFYYQGILFDNEINHRVLQNDNGPCPLLAVINCMLLRQRITFSTQILNEIFPIGFTALIKCLKREIDFVKENLWDDESEVSQTRLIAIANCQGRDIFPKLERGLDINIKFNDIQSFAIEELAHQFFFIYDVKIYHCWVIDPDGIYSSIYHLIAHKTYDQVQDMLVDTHNEHCALIESFLENTKQQRTKYGVHRLYATMNDHEIATLFHNNHYSTIYKHGDDHLIYELVTDQGIVNEKQQIIWKTFNPSNYIHGMDEIFVDSNFNALNQEGKTQLDKLRKIVHHLRKYKYNITANMHKEHKEGEDDEKDDYKESERLIKKVDNTMDFVDKFPIHPLQCKMIIGSKKKKMEIKDDMKMMNLLEAPQSMKRAMSDNVSHTHLGSIIPHSLDRKTGLKGSVEPERYTIRKCRIEDIGVIGNEFGLDKSLNERFWTKEFLTDNTNRNGYVLEDDTANVIGFILYERCEPLTLKDTSHMHKPQLLLRDLSDSRSSNVDMDCKWRATDWNHKQNGKISFYSQFILITELGIHPKHRQKGYGSKLLQSIIYSFPSGTRFAAEIISSHDSAVHCFGKCGFIIKRMENDRFYMTVISDYNEEDVNTFKKLSILKYDKNQIIKELKESKDRIKLFRNTLMDYKEDEDEDDDEIFMEVTHPNDHENDASDDDNKRTDDDDDDDEKHFGETKEEEFSPEKLNRLCSEICCMKHSRLIDCLQRVIDRVMIDVYIRLDIDDLKRDFKLSCFDPMGDLNADGGTEDDKYIKLAMDILFCSGFVQRRYGDSAFYLMFEAGEDDIWKLEATQELITKYQINVHTKKNRMNLLRAIGFDANSRKHWKHVFDADAHGTQIRNKTVRLLKKICVGIIKNGDDLSHKSRNLNYDSLRVKFECQIPLLLLSKYGFEQQENLYKQQIRFLYRSNDISPIKQMFSKIEYEEKLMMDRNIFSAMPAKLQMLWVHTLSTVHGERVRVDTIATLKKICDRILNDPTNPSHRNLNYLTLNNRFRCGIPMSLLVENGFVQSIEPYNIGGAIRLRYDSSDLTPIKNMLNILEKGERLDAIDIASMQAHGHGGKQVMSVDELRMLMTLKSMNNNYTSNNNNLMQMLGNAQGNGMAMNDGNSLMKMLTSGRDNSSMMDIGMTSLGNDDDYKSGYNEDENHEMDFMEMRSYLGNIGLADYAGSFLNNGIKTKDQLLQFDPAMVGFFIDNKVDQNKFINWLNHSNGNGDAHNSRISGI